MRSASPLRMERSTASHVLRETGKLDLFGDENLAKRQRLAKARQQGGKPALRRELAAMYPEKAAADPKSARPPKSPTSTSSRTKKPDK